MQLIIKEETVVEAQQAIKIQETTGVVHNLQGELVQELLQNVAKMVNFCVVEMLREGMMVQQSMVTVEQEVMATMGALLVDVVQLIINMVVLVVLLSFTQVSHQEVQQQVEIMEQILQAILTLIMVHDMAKAGLHIKVDIIARVAHL